MSILDNDFINKIAKGGFILNTIFILLSGFLLAQSASKSNLTFYSFIKRRVSRIYPPFLISILFVFLYNVLIINNFNFQDFFLWITGFGYFFNTDVLSTNHLWFVSVILMCYILFFPTIYLIKKFTIFYLIFIFFILIVSDYCFQNSQYFYANISSVKLNRFLYHYFVFSLGIFFFH